MCQGRRAEVLVPSSVPSASWASGGGCPPRPVRRAMGGRAGPARRGEGPIWETAQSAGPGPWGQVGLLRQPLPRGRWGGRAACCSCREQQLQLGCNI